MQRVRVRSPADALLVPGGANMVPVFFSSGCSRMGWSAPEPVNELKAMLKDMTSSGSWESLSWMMVVLAVPAPPTSITGF